MDLDAALDRYLQNPDVASWLFSTESVRTVSSTALDNSFVYSVGWSRHIPGAPRTMDVEDMLIITSQVGTFILGHIFSLGMPHMFAATPLMLSKVPIARRFAVDFSPKNVLEFMEFITFPDGKIIVVFRQFLHSHDHSLPVVACARLHAASKLKETLGPVLMSANFFEAPCCPSCGLVGKMCVCAFDSYRPDAAVKRKVWNWEQFSGMFMRKARMGTVKLQMSAVLPGIGEMRILDQEYPVLNILQRGDTEYMRLMKRKAVHGLGVHVVMARVDAGVVARSVELDFLELHNRFVIRKRDRRDREEEKHTLYADAEKERGYWATGADEVGGYIRGEGSLESVENVLGLFGAAGMTETSPRAPATKRIKAGEMSPVENVLGLFGAAGMTETSPRAPSPKGVNADEMSPVAQKDSGESRVGIEELDLALELIGSTVENAEDREKRIREQIVQDMETMLGGSGGISVSSEKQETGAENMANGRVLVEEIEKGLQDRVSGTNGGIVEEMNQIRTKILRDVPQVTDVPVVYTTPGWEVTQLGAEERVSQNRAMARKANEREKRAKTKKRGKKSEGEGAGEEKKHECQQCGSRFKMRGDLLRHVKIVHEGKKMYRCGTCGKAFGHSGHLNRHISSVHLQQRRFKCELCGFQFFQASHLQSHIGHIHGIKRKFECGVCGYRASNGTDLKKHREQSHGKRNKKGAILCGIDGCQEKCGSEREREVHWVREHGEKFRAQAISSGSSAEAGEVRAAAL